MSLELEVKVINVDLDIMEEKLKAIGADLIAFEFQKNIIFKEDLLRKTGTDGYLRIREVEDGLTGKKSQELTLKKQSVREGLRFSEEVNIPFENTEGLLDLLESLGCNVENIGYKTRRSYLYDNIRFDLDLWDRETLDMPYMEIELESYEDLERAVDLLNIDRKNITTKSIKELRGV